MCTAWQNGIFNFVSVRQWRWDFDVFEHVIRRKHYKIGQFSFINAGTCKGDKQRTHMTAVTHG